MEARNADGSWAGEDQGWTEGDKWAYTFNVVQDIPSLIERKGGKEDFVRCLDEHFEGGTFQMAFHTEGHIYSLDHEGHNHHTNEVRKIQYPPLYYPLIAFRYSFQAFPSHPISLCSRRRTCENTEMCKRNREIEL